MPETKSLPVRAALACLALLCLALAAPAAGAAAGLVEAVLGVVEGELDDLVEAHRRPLGNQLR